MKNLFLFLLPAVMLFAAGCKDKNGADDVNALTVNPELITCPATGGDYELTVSSPNGAWTATPSESWIRVTPTSGEQGSATIRVKISVNKESVASKGSIVFKSGEETVELPVSRAAKAAPYLRVVSEKELNTPKEGGTYTVQIESNIKWSASSNAGWAKVNKGVTVNNDNITVTVDAATMPQETEALIVVKPYGEGYEAGSDTVYITRGSTDATSLTVDPTEINAPENGGSFTVNVSSNAKWRVWKTWDMDWLKFSDAAEGDGSGSFSFSIEEATSMDDVSGILTIEEDRSDNYKPVVTQVAVSRKGKAAASLSVSPIAINAPAEGYEVPVEIKSNYPWTASLVGARIFSVSATSGDGDATMIVTVKPTTEKTEATGSITIRSSFGNEQTRINIHRDAYVPPVPEPSLRVYPVLISATAEGGEFTLNLTSNCAWTGTSSNTRVASFYPTSGTGSATISVIVAPTASTTPSNATLTFTSADGSLTETVEVRRGAEVSCYVRKPFSVSRKKRVYFSEGNLQFHVSGYHTLWRFAKYQYECFGLVANIRDLFVWGSGKGPEAETTTYNFIDWGSDQIHDPWTEYIWEHNSWRTLTSDEWDYILNSRSNAQNLRGRATVNNKHGFVLLPDSWVLPAGLQFNANATGYSSNIYSIEDWKRMEANGAVFLPASGYMYNSSVGEFGTNGYYWTSDMYTQKLGIAEWEVDPIHFQFDVSGFDITHQTLHGARDAFSVRLVCDLDGLK